MSEAMTTPRFAVELRSHTSSAVVASAAYDDSEQALQAYCDAAEVFRAAKMPAGSSLSLNDQQLELHGGAVSEGFGVIRHSWSKGAARERFDQTKPSKAARPEQAALRDAFAGKAATATADASSLKSGIRPSWLDGGEAAVAMAREDGLLNGLYVVPDALPSEKVVDGALPAVEVIDVDRLPDWTLTRTVGKVADSSFARPGGDEEVDLNEAGNGDEAPVG
jgi:hypothetical protein